MKRQTALRLVDTRTLDRQQWLEVRRGGIGSSDAAAAVGLNPYKSPLALWMDKTGRAVEQEDAAEDMDDPRYWGTLLEPYVAAAYQRKTGRKVRKVNAVLQHPTFPFLLANLDREIVGDPDVQILECKTAGEFGARLWKDGVPDYVQLQVQHQLAVTGKQAADVAVLLCGQQLEVHRIERDDELIGRLILLETRFWEHVETDTPPPADGSESSAKALRQLYRDQGTVLDFTGNRDLDGAFSALVSLREELDAKEQEAERLKQVIQQAMGEASKACFSRGEVTYKGAKESASWDVKRLASDHPDLAAQYVITRPGARRFVVTANSAA
ncbi:MAG TPA: YqaJ viral recombinase family protein [Edaphobacter sp.]|uniref:YqaJ viral recombinase family nuclease n=1 Tax=Rhodanobacter sp. PCA2 TaxID=2006117 RepID=UPI000AA4D4E7|nr:YqaJ viral recombinase family protein [Rhodanobacter sp. PCA2]MBA2079411.1 endonuclease [Rhodanobacter sp. PCA2]HEU4636954.1 YqaJ viral recombinase family protein [Edaphobacter sp.]